MAMAQAEGEAKQKRRRSIFLSTWLIQLMHSGQNVACDPCKLRRIKCDLLTLLTPNESTSTAEPLHVLVQRHPDVHCTHCRGKGLRCTTEQIVNPSKPNKGGRRIEEARRKFGSDGTVKEDDGPEQAGWSQSDDKSGVEWLPSTSSQIACDPFIGAGALDPRNPSYGFSSIVPALFGDYSSTLGLPQIAFAGATPLPAQSTGPDAELPGPANLPILDYSQPFDPSSSAPIPADTSYSSSSRSATASNSRSPDELVSGPTSHEEAKRIWEHLTVYREQAIKTPLPNVGPISDPAWMESALTRSGPRPGYDGGRSSTNSSAHNGRSERSASSNGPSSDLLPPLFSSPLGRPEDHHHGSTWSLVEAPPQPQSLGLKRPHSVVPGYPLDEQERDPWRIFSRAIPAQRVRWTRREEMQEHLADRALGIELSRELVKVFFQAVHTSFPAISPEAFYLEWQRADQRSDRMTVQQEVLCTVIEAWGARYSDSPVVLGLNPSRASDAPKVISPQGRFVPGTQARMYWGRARQNVCKALVERCRRIVDESGILRRPTVTGLQAIILFHQLLHLGNDRDRPKEAWMEIQMLLSTIIEQTKVLSLMWDAPGAIPEDENELPLGISQIRMKQRRIFWTVLIGESFWSAGSGNKPRIDEEELVSSGRWLAAILDRLPPSSFKVLASYLMSYHRLAILARKMADKVSCPGQRKGTVVVSEMCNAIREIWADAKTVVLDMNSTMVALLDSCHRSQLGFSPLSYLINIRMAVPLLLIMIHENIRSHLEFRQTLKQAYIVDDAAPRENRPGETDVMMLQQLEGQSVDVILQNARQQTRMLKRVLPTGMIQTASVLLGVVMSNAQFMAEVPTNEQGYPSDTLGGEDWTWETKQREIAICTEALYQIGWAWSDVGGTVDAVMLAMERMQPTPDQLENYQLTTPLAPSLAASKRQEEAIDDQALSLALPFWPTLDYEDLSRQVLEGGKIAGMSPNFQPYSLDNQLHGIDDIGGNFRAGYSIAAVQNAPFENHVADGRSRPASAGQRASQASLAATTRAMEEPQAKRSRLALDPEETSSGNDLAVQELVLPPGPSAIASRWNGDADADAQSIWSTFGSDIRFGSSSQSCPAGQGLWAFDFPQGFGDTSMDEQAEQKLMTKVDAADTADVAYMLPEQAIREFERLFGGSGEGSQGA